MKHIFFVEDDLSLINGLSFAIKKQGYALTVARTSVEAEQLWENGNYDLVILDVTLPDGSGFDLCRKIRASSKVPIMFLTAADEETDIIMGLDIGGDDYMTKPFSPSELVARVDAIYRRVALAEMRTENNFKEEIHSGEFSLNLRNRYLLKRGQPIELTQVEFQIMEYFFSNPATALDRTDILKHVWGESYFGEEKIVDVNIRRLRMKVEDEPSNPKHIVTVWGLGYKWEA